MQLKQRIWVSNEYKYSDSWKKYDKNGKPVGRPKHVWQDPTTGTLHHKMLDALSYGKKSPYGPKVRCDWPGCRIGVVLPDELKYIIKPGSMYFTVTYGEAEHTAGRKYKRNWKIYFHETCYYKYIREVVTLGGRTIKSKFVKNKITQDEHHE